MVASVFAFSPFSSQATRTNTSLKKVFAATEVAQVDPQN